MNQDILSEFKTALVKEHDKLVAELKAFAKPSSSLKNDWDANFPTFEPAESGSHASLEEEADEIEEYEVRLEAEHSLESRLLQITRALERISRGGYGICTHCRKEIAPDRLKANPAAEACLEHSN